VVRDLFIRLQSGTALTRQQIRDAWPGAVGPYIEKLAGKLDRQPAIGLFALVDKRGIRSEDDRDRHEADRQLCAQLLCVFLARERDPNAEQSVGAEDLDKLYHDNTAFPVDGPSAKRFEETLAHATQVFRDAAVSNILGGVVTGSRVRKKFKKLDVLATALLVQDLTRSPNLKLGDAFYQNLAQHLSGENHIGATGKSISGPVIADYYRRWRSTLPDLGIRLDSKRSFDEDQKVQMLKRQNGKCAVCGKALTLSEAEGDHYPVPHSLGGPTSLDNGRVVHKEGCHQRGRVAPVLNDEVPR
jgi:hypothetical protein